MSERTENQTKTEEEQARERAEFVDFQSGLWDLISQLGTALSSLAFFGAVLYLVGGLHALGYFSVFGAKWLVWELPGNSFPFRVLSQVVIFIFSVTVGTFFIRSIRKWSRVMDLIAQHEPHKDSLMGTSLSNLGFFLFILIFILLWFANSSYPWMVTHPYWSYGLSVLWVVVFVPWSIVFVQPSPNIKRDIFTSAVFAVVLVPLSMLVFSFWRPLFERYTTITSIFLVWWGILFGIAVGVRVLADLAHSNRDSLPEDSIPSRRRDWKATNAFPLYGTFLWGLSAFSYTHGIEQSIYDLGASRSTLPIVVLEGENSSCRRALLVTNRLVYTVTLQPFVVPDVVPFSWEKISRIQAPQSGRCPEQTS